MTQLDLGNYDNPQIHINLASMTVAEVTEALKPLNLEQLAEWNKTIISIQTVINSQLEATAKLANILAIVSSLIRTTGIVLTLT